ncbi:MAG: mechanosensitive ion channel [Alphaproteobacteria bacterium]|nr:mechanosensitive ion channel [Alphaproteobacteria bacterium]
MEPPVDIGQVNQLIQDLIVWTQAHVLVIPNLLQLAFPGLAYYTARAAARPVRNILERILAEPWAERWRGGIGKVFYPLLMPVIWLMLIAAAKFTAAQMNWPIAIVAVAGSLLNAWVGIRLLLNFIADPWWSRATAMFVWALAALDIVGLLDPTLAFLDKLALNIGEFRLSLLLVAKGIIALVVFLWLANWAAKVVETRLRHFSQLTPSQRVLFGKLARVLFVTMAILITLNSTGIDLTALAVFSGALGLGIGFGLQKVAANLLSGVILLLDRSVKPGDVVAVNNSYGWINTIGARYVSVVTRDGIEHLIPNEHLISTPVENWSYSDNLVRLRLPVGISYESDVKKAIALAEQAGGEFERILKNPPIKCLLRGFGDNAVNLELRVWVNDPQRGVSNIKSEIYLRMWDLFHENNIDFPYPQTDIHVKGPVNVRMEG